MTDSTIDLTPFSLQVTRDEAQARVTIAGDIPKQQTEQMYGSIVESASREMKVDGFREGKVPASVVEAKVGSLALWRKAAQEVIMNAFPTILSENQLVPLGPPELQFTSIADKGDVRFSISFFVMPAIDLPEYKATLKDVQPAAEPEAATDEEVQAVTLDIRRSLFKRAHPEKAIPEDAATLPELTDANVQEISTTYKDVASFLGGVKEDIGREKKVRARAEFRHRLLDALLAKTSIQVPANVVEEESKRSFEELKAQATALQTTVEDYLAAQNMTEEQLRTQLREEAEKRSQVQFLLSAVSEKENIRANRDEVEREVERFKRRAGDSVPDEKVWVYIDSMLTNEAVIQFLEKQVGV